MAFKVKLLRKTRYKVAFLFTVLLPFLCFLSLWNWVLAGPTEIGLKIKLLKPQMIESSD